MADITYDVSSLESAKRSIDDLVTALDTDNTKLNTSLTDLQKAWKTDAGKKFFKDHKDTWTEYVKQYTKKLNGVSKMLGKAINEYQKITDEVDKLDV